VRIRPWSEIPKPALLLPLIGLVAGFLTSFLIAPRYVSTAVMALQELSGDPDRSKIHHNLIEFYLACQGEVTSRSSLSALIQNPSVNLYEEERQKLPLEDVIEKMRHEVQVTIEDRPGYPRETTTVFRIRFVYPNPFKAQAATQLLITRFIDTAQRRILAREYNDTPPGAVTRIEQLEARVAELEKRAGIGAPDSQPHLAVPIRAEVLEPASLPERAESPNRPLFAGAGLLAGFAALLAAAISRRRIG